MGVIFSMFLEGKFLVIKFELEGSFGRSLEGDCHEVEVTLNLELLITIGISLGELVMSCKHNFTISLYLIWKQPKNHKKAPS